MPGRYVSLVRELSSVIKPLYMPRPALPKDDPNYIGGNYGEGIDFTCLCSLGIITDGVELDLATDVEESQVDE